MRKKLIGKYLRRSRKERGFTQKDVAYILGLKSSSMISRWEKGVALPDIFNALKLTIVYCKGVDILFHNLHLDMQTRLSGRIDEIVKLKGLPQDPRHPRW